jgi:hypothetical protein
VGQVCNIFVRACREQLLQPAVALLLLAADYPYASDVTARSQTGKRAAERVVLCREPDHGLLALFSVSALPRSHELPAANLEPLSA